ncbi:hypothetical protein KBF38_23715 [bacterium]|nr:hypothetical protein [bacterium]
MGAESAEKYFPRFRTDSEARKAAKKTKNWSQTKLKEIKMAQKSED